MDTCEWETHPRTWPATASTCSTKTMLASDNPEHMSSQQPIAAQEQPRHTCHSHEFWNCLHCGIAFKRDFVDRVSRADPERSYDALVQFGNAPITSIVNLQWKREALAKYNTERSSAVNYEKLLSDHTEKRQSRQNKLPPKQRSKGTIKWKRPICKKKQKCRSGGVAEVTPKDSVVIPETH